MHSACVYNLKKETKNKTSELTRVLLIKQFKIINVKFTLYYGCYKLNLLSDTQFKLN